jgi:hypothetical protein
LFIAGGPCRGREKEAQRFDRAATGNGEERENCHCRADCRRGAVRGEGRGDQQRNGGYEEQMPEMQRSHRPNLIPRHPTDDTRRSEERGLVPDGQ